MELFAGEDKVEYDLDGATAYKAEHEAKIKEKEDAAAALTGKDNKKARTELSKEVSAMKAEEKYVDACKVVKGLPPPKGNFAKGQKNDIKAKKTDTPETNAAPAEEAKK